MEVRDVFALALKRRWTVVLVTLLTAGLGAAFAFTQPKKYESVATIALTPDTSAETQFVPSDTLNALVQTYAQTARSRVNINRARELNNGEALPGTVETETRERWDQVVAVDQLGTWLGMQHVGPVIQAAGGGSVVNVASILGATGGLANSFSYAAAKGAVRAMTMNAALHWARRGVRVNAVVPAFIGTASLFERYGGTERHDAMLAHTPMGRLGRPEEVAAAVAFLASDDAAYTTGSEIYVDGGWAAR